MPVEEDKNKGLVLGKGKLPEQQATEGLPTLKPPTLITPEVVIRFDFANRAQFHTLLIIPTKHVCLILFPPVYLSHCHIANNSIETGWPNRR